MKKFFLFIAFSFVSIISLMAQPRDLGLLSKSGSHVTDMAVVQRIPFEKLKGYQVTDPSALTGDAQVFMSQDEFDRFFVVKDKATPVNFTTHYVVTVSPAGPYKFRKFKIDDVFYNNGGQIVVKTSSKADDYQWHVLRFGTAPDGTKVPVTALEGEPYEKANEKRPYLLIAIARANNGDVVEAGLTSIRANGRIDGTKEERKALLQFEREGKIVY